MNRTLDNIGNGYRLCILGDLNGLIGDGTRADITGAFQVPGKNDNGRRVVEFCTERGLCVGNAYILREDRYIEGYLGLFRGSK